VKRLVAMLAVAVGLVLPGTALALPLTFTSLSPDDGAQGFAGNDVFFQITGAPYSGLDPYIELEVSRSPALDPDGTLADDFVVRYDDSIQGIPDGTGQATYRTDFSFGGGTFWWQFFLPGYDPGPVRSFTIIESPALDEDDAWDYSREVAGQTRGIHRFGATCDPVTADHTQWTCRVDWLSRFAEWRGRTFIQGYLDGGLAFWQGQFRGRRAKFRCLDAKGGTFKRCKSPATLSG
jgi:hypothetical protein